MIGMMMQYRCPQKSQASRHLIAGPWRLMFIAALVGCMAWLLTATPVAAGETLPCEVMVKFEDDDAGVATLASNWLSASLFLTMDKSSTVTVSPGSA